MTSRRARRRRSRTPLGIGPVAEAVRAKWEPLVLDVLLRPSPFPLPPLLTAREKLTIERRRARLRRKAARFLKEYRALCDRYHIVVEGIGYECDGEELRFDATPEEAERYFEILGWER